MRLASRHYLSISIIQRTVGRADRLHARKQSVAWPPHPDIADYYLQSFVRFVWMFAPLLRPGTYVWRFTAVCQANYTIDCLCGIIRRQCRYARLPVAVKLTSMHVLVCTYEGRYILYGRPLYDSCIVQYDNDMQTERTTIRSTVLTRTLRGGELSMYHTWNDITAMPTRWTRLARRDNQRFHGCIPTPPYPYI